MIQMRDAQIADAAYENYLRDPSGARPLDELMAEWEAMDAKRESEMTSETSLKRMRMLFVEARKLELYLLRRFFDEHERGINRLTYIIRQAQARMDRRCNAYVDACLTHSAELERQWPQMPNLVDGKDVFADKFGKPTGEPTP